MGNFFLGITVGAAALLILSYFQNSAFFSLLPLIYIDLQNENPCDILALMQENDDADIADIVLLKLASFHWRGLWQEQKTAHLAFDKMMADELDELAKLQVRFV